MPRMVCSAVIVSSTQWAAARGGGGQVGHVKQRVQGAPCLWQGQRLESVSPVKEIAEGRRSTVVVFLKGEAAESTRMNLIAAQIANHFCDWPSPSAILRRPRSAFSASNAASLSGPSSDRFKSS